MLILFLIVKSSLSISQRLRAIICEVYSGADQAANSITP